MVTYADYESYNWVSVGDIGLISDIKFFILESPASDKCVEYVTEYKVNWINKHNYDYLDESMLTKVESTK